MVDTSELPWAVIGKYFECDEHILVKHQLASYNLFIKDGMSKILRDENPLSLEFKDEESETNHDESALIKYRCKLYLGGRDGRKIYYGKPIIYDYNSETGGHAHFMYPNEARLRNMTYGATIHVDVDVVIEFPNTQPNAASEGRPFETMEYTLPRVYLGRFPIMVHSDLCILKGLSTQVRFYAGECRNDHGGYFIINGKEKVIISQEKFADNLLNIRVLGGDEEGSGEVYTHSADIRTVSEDPSKPARTMAVRIVAPTPSHTHGNIVVCIPNVRSPVPLFIVMRALGIESDRDIIEHCLYDLTANAQLVDMFIPSVHDANKIFTQAQALQFIGLLTKWKTADYAHEVLINYFLPQVGEMNYRHKACMLGYITNKLLRVAAKIDAPTDRDSFCNKRVEVSGTLIYDLFREYYKLQFKSIRLSIDEAYYYQTQRNQNYQDANFTKLVSMDNYQQYFKDRILELGIKRAFKGNWGATAHTKRVGVIQDLNRLSYNSFISHLRKINLEMDAGAKLVKPRMLHSSQWGMIDPVDVPDGANTGLHKHLAMTAHITAGCSAQPMLDWLRDECKIRLIDECSPFQLFHMSKVLVNGTLWGATDSPEALIAKFKFHRRIALIPIYISVRWHIPTNEILIFTDAGRLCRPVFYHDDDTDAPSYAKGVIKKYIDSNDFLWEQLVTGFSEKIDSKFDYDKYAFYSMGKLYEPDDEHGTADKADGGSDGPSKAHSQPFIERLKLKKAIIEFLDQSETESALISIRLPSLNEARLNKHHSSQRKRDNGGQQQQHKLQYTHYEIHPSLMLGVMGNQICFVENNQFPRDAFGCGHAKQTASLYHSNFFSRIDKMSMVLNGGQVPLVKSRYLEYINNEEHPNGENAIVAIMCYSGYNVEDSILFNEAAVKRGLFNITYYNMYEDCEEGSSSTTVAVPGARTSTHFSNMLNAASVRGINPDHNYAHLDAHGIVKENTELDDRTVIIGKISRSADSPDEARDTSTITKKGQTGYVDRAYMTESDRGTRLAKVRVRDHRYPAVGDKFCSRCGQKGTVGFIVPERDMPFTADGVRPDIIINPHAIPSRMTVGQLIETVMGKACVLKGGFGDCTAFVNQGPRDKVFGRILAENGFHSSGNQVLHSGMSGEQIDADIFIGPTYYMRLKQMVKDKINYRRTGPVTALTRQPVQGRANDGGLRVGEMERDSIISHGTAHFLQESMMERGDQYYLAICNTTGMIAIYNETQNLFISPMADGPIKYADDLNELKSAHVVNVTRHGRSFSVVRVPYALKLLIQELQTMNVQMRVITDANIDQIATLGFSKNIQNLMMDAGADLSTVASETARALGTKLSVAAVAHLRGDTGDSERGGDDVGSDADADNMGDDDINVDMFATPGAKPRQRRRKGPTGADYASMTVSEIERAVAGYGWLFSGVNPADGEVYASIVTDGTGNPTEYWRLKEHNHQYPTRFPMGWSDIKWPSSVPIENADKIAALKRFPSPVATNLERAYEHLLITRDRKYPVSSTDDAENASSSAMSHGIRKSGRDADVAANTLNIGVLKHNEYAVNEARILDINKSIQHAEMEIEDIKSKAVDAMGSSGSATSSSQHVAVGPTKIIEAKLLEISKLQTERDELASKMALEREISQRAVEIMTSPSSSNSNSNSSPVNYYGIYPGSGYEPSTPPYSGYSASGGGMQQQQQQQAAPMMMSMQPTAMMMPMPMQMPMQMQMPIQSGQQGVGGGGGNNSAAIAAPFPAPAPAPPSANDTKTITLQ